MGSSLIIKVTGTPATKNEDAFDLPWIYAGNIVADPLTPGISIIIISDSKARTSTSVIQIEDLNGGFDTWGWPKMDDLFIVENPAKMGWFGGTPMTPPNGRLDMYHTFCDPNLDLRWLTPIPTWTGRRKKPWRPRIRRRTHGWQREIPDLSGGVSLGKFPKHINRKVDTWV